MDAMSGFDDRPFARIWSGCSLCGDCEMIPRDEDAP